MKVKMQLCYFTSHFPGMKAIIHTNTLYSVYNQVLLGILYITRFKNTKTKCAKKGKKLTQIGFRF